ncbi:MF13A protein, partial [Panurus biarmicus]|nr:MF13A protein [Panurus biarmicus]
ILWGIHANALAYSMTTLSAGMMSSIFNFYYVKLFLNRYKISETAFHVAQVVYMIWNASSEALFGCARDIGRRRLSAVPAPLYGLAFLLPWFPWQRPEQGGWLGGLQLAAALCAFGGLLSSLQRAPRAPLPASAGRLAALVGSTSVLFCGLVSDNMDNFAAFQAFAVVIAALATACVCCTGKYSGSEGEQRGHAEGAALENGDGASSLASVFSLAKQIMSEKNFVCFVTMNFFQVFHLAFYNNFMMIFADNLIPKDVLSSSLRSVMYGAGFICPQCLVLLSHASLKKFGYYRVILFSFYYEGVAAAVMCLLGQEHYHLLALYITTNILCCALICFFPKYFRLPLFSMFFGTNALFTKPAQSLAPMFVIAILNHYGYYNLNNVPDLHDAMFYLVCLVPLCIAVLQILTWTPFSIQN